MRSIGVALLVSSLLASAASATEVKIPFSVPPKMVREALMKKVFTGQDGRAHFWGEPGECSFFYLENPAIDGVDGKFLRITAHGEARLGSEFLGGCFSPVAWSGYLEILEDPKLEEWTIRFKVSDSNIYNEQHEKTLLFGKLWDRIKEDVQPRFESVTVDLRQVFDELRAFIPMVAPPDSSAEVQKALDSLHPVEIEVTLPGWMTITSALEVAQAPTPATRAPEPPLTAPEIEAFTARVDQWDAFVTFVVKELGRKTLQPKVRDALLENLVEARYEILDALDQPARGEDPMRRLFISTWQRLWPVAENVADELPGAGAIRIVSFIAAGDALTVLDQAGPSFGIEISADGLRRLARLVEPEIAVDPLEETERVDPALRRSLGFGSLTGLEATPQPAGEPTPEQKVLQPITPAPTPGAGSWWWQPRQAWAAVVDHSVQWKGWTFNGSEDVKPYLARVGKLLRVATDQMITTEKLAGPGGDLYRKLVPAAAWQESCWRQFLDNRGTVTYLRSTRGSVGILQVNERVWRGFYEVDRLRWSIEYNVRAGSDILLRYLRMTIDKQGQIKPAEIPQRARAVYALYNGGPGQYRRYLDVKGRGRTLARVVDQLFGEKFDGLASDVETKVAQCLTG